MKLLIRISYLIPLLLLLITSCHQFEGDQEIPSYLNIEDITLTHNSIYPEGSLSAEISGCRLYVDDEFIGFFEIPGTIPILEEGTHEINIYPGIIYNGMSSTRTVYPFYTSITTTGVELIPGTDIADLGVLQTTYNSSTVMPWEEGFDNSYISMDTTSDSSVDFTLTPAGSDETFYGNHSGKVTLSEDSVQFMSITKTGYDLPNQSQPIYLEINYKNTNFFTVGILIKSPDGLKYQDIIHISPSEEWNKMYIYLSPTVSYYPTAYEYKIYFSAYLDSGLEEGTILLDNIRLVHLNY